MSPHSDYFSQHAEQYAAHRPHYPSALFEWLAERAPSRGRAWDCGTGSGQAAIALAECFDEVIATDVSHAQVVHAMRSPRVHYVVSTAEESVLPNASVELVTVAQALHWFQLERFTAEVGRVLVPGGVLAVWNYGLLRVDPAIDERILAFYRDEVSSFWPAERALVDKGYGELMFPFGEMGTPAFQMYADWTLEQLGGYLATWSAATRYEKAHGESPVPKFIDSLRDVWGSAAIQRRIEWPLEVRAFFRG